MRILVVGASGELGSAIVRRLASSPSNRLILHAYRNTSKLDNLADEVGAVEVVNSDVRSEEGVAKMFEQVGLGGGLDGLVYAAGVNPTAKSISDTPLDDWRLAMGINLDGAFLCVRGAIPLVRNSQNGSMVLVSSVFGLSSPANRGAYSSAKHALNGIVQTVSREEAPRIRINAVCPGAMWTENVRRIFPQHAASVGISVEEYVKQRCQRIPAGRFLELSECASLVAYLLGPDAKFITGESIRIAGGET